MNILVRIPNWLGDAVMATYALEILFECFPKAHFYLVGSRVSVALFTHYPRVSILIDSSKKAKSRIFSLYKLAKEIPPCTLAFTFQNSLLSALLLYFNGARFRVGFAKEMRSFLLHHHPKKPKNTHEASRFAMLVESALHSARFQNLQIQIDSHAPIAPKLYLQKPPLKVTLPTHFSDSKIIGINAGAAFGAAKRWEEAYFAEVAAYFLQQNCNVILFGVESENPINDATVKHTQTLYPTQNCILNLSGKTTIESLMAYFLKLDFLLTNDSGPMHIASAFGIPTLALFGPTNALETCPFNAPNAQIISLETLGDQLPCMPCMQRTCPLPKDSKDFHACMRNLTPNLVIAKIQSLISKLEIQSALNSKSEPR